LATSGESKGSSFEGEEPIDDLNSDYNPFRDHQLLTSQLDHILDPHVCSLTRLDSYILWQLRLGIYLDNFP